MCRKRSNGLFPSSMYCRRGIRACLVVMLSLGFGVSTPSLARQGVEGTEMPAPVVRQNVRVVYDISHDEQEAGIGNALFYARGLLAAYASLGVPLQELDVHLVLHGGAAYWALNEDAYQRYRGDPFEFNPHAAIIEKLITDGVHVEVCNATLKANGWGREDLLPGVLRVHDGYTRIIDLQLQGHAYLYF